MKPVNVAVVGVTGAVAKSTATVSYVARKMVRKLSYSRRKIVIQSLIVI